MTTQNDPQQKKQLLDKWSFSWPIMNVLIGGRSSIDLPEIQITSMDEATRFVKSYGYDVHKHHDARLIHAVIVESLGFIERHLMPKEWRQGVVPPTDVMNCEDVRLLLLWACDRNPDVNQRRIWSCAILRVMHTIAHIEGAFRYSDIDAARDEIMARFQSILHFEKDCHWLVTGDHRVKIQKIEWKTQKTRDSVLLKLLHKRANVAETIYDMIGIRIITDTQADALQVVNILYRSHVISFPNAIPSRSRNSLADQDVFRVQLDELRGKLLTGAMTTDDLIKKIDELRVPPPIDQKDNQHSGDNYQAIQLTGRQLIRTPRPITLLRKQLESAAQAELKNEPIARYFGEMAHVLKNITRISGDEEFAFFPFEIQVMDRRAYETNSTGKASHGRYKRSQVKAARRRVLNEILPLA